MVAAVAYGCNPLPQEDWGWGWGGGAGGVGGVGVCGGGGGGVEGVEGVGSESPLAAGNLKIFHLTQGAALCTF